jgi:antitoxin component YwqK of YwqJK toxin-antitoxin module
MKGFYKIGMLLFLFLNVVHIQAQVETNKLDEKGKKHGLWKGFYPETKHQKYEGTFDHGKEVGVFTYYDNTHLKSVIATREFNPKDNSAYTIFYDQLKNKVSEGKVVGKAYEGKWIYYHRASDVIMSTENYSNGKLEGVRSVYYPSGKIAEEMTYKNGLKNGVYKRYTESGIVIEESSYKNDEYDGVATFRGPDDGIIVSTGKFTKGKKSGKWQFFKNGKLDHEVNMSDPKSVAKMK